MSSVQARTIMRYLLGTLAIVILATIVHAQPGSVRILTTPTPPKKDILERMSLTSAWYVRVKTEGSRDGLVSVQVIPPASPQDNPQIIVQTFSGTVMLLDGE